MVLWSSSSITVASRPPLDTSTVIPALAMFSLGMPTYNGGGQHTSLSDVPVSIPNVYKYILAKLDFWYHANERIMCYCFTERLWR